MFEIFFTDLKFRNSLGNIEQLKSFYKKQLNLR